MSQTLLLTDSRTAGVIFDKRLGTNIIAAALVGIGFWFSEPWSETLLNIGLFSLSGALTNWLAVYMLFERVPGIYGSGVVQLHFEDFKTGIHQLIMLQFFDRINVEKFFSGKEGSKLLPDFKQVFKKVNLNPAFDSLLEIIQNSSFGPLLSMAGGVQSLESLREPFKEKLQTLVQKITESEAFQQTLREKQEEFSASEDILEKVDAIVTERLNELTPDMVKEIIERMIQQHLGWLVVWGGVFGGMIGLITSLVI
ncbi:MAG: hypothetical protein MAG581_00360 [Deltaproteobacteria bacterium]|jgi:uncharacterized membrane protein YheB (UPF0754 family)|nr:hypothetical protein [Deltaproteobacteria bacterium]